MDVLNDGISDISIVDFMGSDDSVVRAARVSYQGDGKTGGDPEKDAKLIKYMADHSHGTPFEHTAVTFHVACPIFVVRQWHRHRIGWSYNETSRRYTSDDVQIYTPDEWHKQDTKNKQGSSERVSNPYLTAEYRKAVWQAYESYERLLKAGVAREEARMVLPQSTYTRFYATANLRSIAHFIGLRSDEHAQRHIRSYSNGMYELVKELFPISIGALVNA